MDRNSPWGMVVHSASEWDIEELHKGGVAFLRIDFRWDVLQPSAGSAFQWLHFDRIVRWAVDRGMWILAGLGGTPEWAVDPARMNADRRAYRADAYPAANLDLWSNYVAQVVGRYAQRGVRYWGVWNEPDSFNEPANVCFWRGSQQEFFDGVLTRAIDVLRFLGPDHRVCVPDLARADAPNVPWHPHWLRDLLARFGANIHAATVHVYRGTGDGSDVIGGAAAARNLVNQYNASHGRQIELWITETGWHTGQHSEATISSKIQDLCAETRRAPWVRKIFPYTWSDSPAEVFSFKSSPRTTRQQWAGYKAGINAPQPPVALERDALVVTHNIPPQMSRGQVHGARMTFRNTGRWGWPRQGSIRLAFGSRPTPVAQPFAVKIDTTDGRLQQVCSSVAGIIAQPRAHVPAAVPPGGEVTFSFPITAPAQAGCHYMAMCMVDDNPADPMFFGQGLLERLFVQ
jgi:hypothetical protein